MRMLRRCFHFTALGIAALCIANVASAQSGTVRDLPSPIAAAPRALDLNARPNHGTRTIGPGFSPDPISAPIITGGDVDVDDMHLGSGCTGYASPAPDFQFTLAAGVSFLRIFVDAGSSDTTLIVHRADGAWQCADDTYGRNPGVDLANTLPGVYNVWVGSYLRGERVRGTFTVTAMASVHPSGESRSRPPPPNNPLNASLPPNFGVRRVRPGFRRDPMRINITSGGNVSVSDLQLGSGCTGHVTTQPDFVIRLTGPSPTLRVYVDRAREGRESADTTLIIRRPNGTWICNDDSFSTRHPTVDLDNAEPGDYALWIGSYRSEVQADARLNITEIRSNHP